MENVRDRTAAAGDHDLSRGNCHGLSRLSVNSYEFFLAGRDLSSLFHFVVGDDVDVSAEDFLCEFRDLGLFFRDKLWIPSYDRDFGPHACEEVAEFCCYVSGA